jgi:hypothetical protein
MLKYQYSGRTDQAKAAFKRFRDACVLRDQKHWRGAMYLAGYSIECKLKVKLMEMFKVSNLKELEAKIEEQTGRSINVFTHSIELLFDLTGVLQRLCKEPKNPSVLTAYRRCNTWQPNWRYKSDDGKQDDCESFLDAVQKFGRFVDNNI